MHMNGNGTNFDNLISEIEQQITDLEQAVEDLKAQMAPYENDLRRLRKMLNAGTGNGPGRKSETKPQAKRYGEEELAIVVTRLRELPEDAWVEPHIPGSFTERSLSENLGVSSDTANRMVKYLREQERIRLVGERKFGRAPRPSRIYVVNDA